MARSMPSASVRVFGATRDRLVVVNGGDRMWADEGAGDASGSGMTGWTLLVDFFRVLLGSSEILSSFSGSSVNSSSGAKSGLAFHALARIAGDG